jgi:hypothetical protein
MLEVDLPQSAALVFALLRLWTGRRTLTPLTPPLEITISHRFRTTRRHTIRTTKRAVQAV